MILTSPVSKIYDPMAGPQYIKAGWLFDGSSHTFKTDMLLRVKDGLFTTIEPFRTSDSLASHLITDLSHCTILPPLVDCHVHLCLSGSTDPQLRKQQLSASYEELRPRMLEHIHQLLSYGILAVRDGGDARGYGLRFAQDNRGDRRDPLLLKVAGGAWHLTGRYGAALGCCPATGETLSQAVARTWKGTDHFKVMQSGINCLKQYGKETAPQFALGELKEAVATAHDRGLKVMVHANGALPVRIALDAGCDSIEHGFFMGRENLRRMADSGTVWVATVCTMKAMAEGTLGGPGVGCAVVQQTLQQQLRQLALAREYGVKLAVGTDAGSWGVHHGAAMVEELQLYTEAGFSLPESLKAATAHGAELLATNSMGNIAVGKPASFIAVQGAPAMLPGALSSLQAIYVNGKACDTPGVLAV